MMKTLLLSTILMVPLLVGCSQGPSQSPVHGEKEREIIAVASRAVSQFETWADNAEYVVERRGNAWRVSAWRVVYPEAKGKDRFVPWGVRVVTIDDAGKVIGYTSGK